MGAVCVDAARRRHTGEQEQKSEEEKMNKAPRMVLNYHYMSTRDVGNGKNPVLATTDDSTGNR